MRTAYKLALVGGALALAATGITLKNRQASTAAANAAASAAAAPSVVEVLASDLVTVQAQDIRRSQPFTGTLKALNQAIVRAKLAGEVREVLVREGQSVKVGQVLAKIDPLEAKARLDQAVANMAQSQAQYQTAKRSYDNNKALLDKGFISPTAFSSSEDSLRAAQAQVAAMQAQVTLAQKGLNDATVRSPINGVVAERAVQPGEKVAVDGKLLTVIDPAQLEIEASIPAEQVANIKLGQTVQLTVEGLSSNVQGQVARINPATATGSRSVPIYVAIKEPGAARSGMFAQGDIVLESRNQVLALPVTALLNGTQLGTQQGQQAKVVVLQNGKLVTTAVSLGLRTGAGNDAWVEITSGLNNGARVLRTNMDNLPPQASVRVAGETPATASASSAAASAASAAQPSRQ